MHWTLIILAAYTKEWEKFRLGVTGGINITDFSQRKLSGGTTLGGLSTSRIL
jgi:hypothetical protein